MGQENSKDECQGKSLELKDKVKAGMKGFVLPKSYSPHMWAG